MKFFELSKFTVKYFVGDGYYGNNTCSNICLEFGINLILSYIMIAILKRIIKFMYNTYKLSYIQIF
jgi:hypothetical protein